jgi:4-diphosphocytidyl-2C-methyl-D-erythritol kinase
VPSATAAAYQAWDEAGLESKGPTVSGILDALQARDLEKVGRLVHNDFTEVLRRNHSGVAEAMAWLGEGESLRVWPTGSGSAVVALDGNRNRARQSAPPSHFSLFTSIATL